MRFVWDPEKERRNRVKHGLRFAFAWFVFSDPGRLIILDLDEASEERWLCYGRVDGGPGVAIVVHTYPDPDDPDLIRVISLRKASKHERRQYEDAR